MKDRAFFRSRAGSRQSGRLRLRRQGRQHNRMGGPEGGPEGADRDPEQRVQGSGCLEGRGGSRKGSLLREGHRPEEARTRTGNGLRCNRRGEYVQGVAADRGPSKFVKAFPEKDKVVLLTTAGGEDWKPKSVEVDAITSASKEQKTAPVADEISRMVRKILGAEGARMIPRIVSLYHQTSSVLKNTFAQAVRKGPDAKRTKHVPAKAGIQIDNEAYSV